jgi:uncharacterized protein (TIGR02265 family)
VADKAWMEEPSLRLRDRIAGAPKGSLVKGWLVHSIVENARRHGTELVTGRKYFGFKDYPVEEYLELLGQAAVCSLPERSPRDTLRELGRGVYGNFSQSLFGKVILTGLGNGHDGAKTGLRWITRVYHMTSNHAVARFTEPNDDVAVIELENVWSFPDAYHVGIFEGAAHGFGGQVSVDIESLSLSSARLTFRWKG